MHRPCLPIKNQLGGALATLLTVCASVVVHAAEQDANAFDFFERKIRPVLIDKCYGCHAADAKTIHGGLLLDTREGIRHGGDSGPAVTPGNVESSLIIDALRYESFEMPPDEQLSQDVIANFAQWIRDGAADPRDGHAIPPQSETVDWSVAGDLWSLQPLQTPHIPESPQDHWSASDIDRFVLARLHAADINPVADADRTTLVRRVYYVLIGLPPTPKQIDAFVEDRRPLPLALASVVDRLIESPQFGVRWGRHWLDVVRFAESSGGGRTLLFPNAWRYRDYVVDCFNQDLPFDEFVLQQIAGDLLPADDWQQARDQLVATAFLVLGPTNYELQDKEVLEMDIIDEQLDTIGKSFLGMTIGCARCHDHKFDPITTRDYYAMAGILHSTQSVTHSNVSKWNTVTLPVPAETESQYKAVEKKTTELNTVLQDLKKQAKQPPETPDTNAAETLTRRIQEIEQQLKLVKQQGPHRPVAMAVRDHTEIHDIPVAIRGVVHNPGPMVPRGVMQFIESSLDMPADRSGRLQLAHWLASHQNPLTARVIVNRIWYWLFNEGLVRSVDNFGHMGTAPTHPELLEHLAVTFVEDDWSIKRLVRRLMLSRVYRLSTAHSDIAFATDPQNQLYWRQRRHRLDAESIRDTLLHLGGNLDRRIGGTHIKPGTKIEYGYTFDSTRRSIYLPVFRNTLPEIFAVFDFSDPNIQNGRRTQSTIAPQSLLLMNHPFVIVQSRLAAERAAAVTHDGTARQREQRIERAFRETLGRRPTPQEAVHAANFLNDSDDLHRWGLLYQTLVQSIDFRYLN
ncbi:MAG: hypothetical protein CMJ80_14275 [Planctomycetaceae bacterium]|nr:hypothetical protein [Planctomycetaceae bacterium]